MGEGLKEEVEFLQGMKKKQLLYVAPEDYIYTWGMTMKDGKIITNSSFNISFSPLEASYKAKLTGDLGKRIVEQIKKYVPPKGALSSGAIYYAITAEMANMLTWEKA